MSTSLESLVDDRMDAPLRQGLDDNKCIGCGRCMKILRPPGAAPKEVDEEESAKMFASVKNPDNCIGCEACGRTCSKKAFSFEPLLM